MTDLPTRLPRHVAIIVDGNGRWAERRGLPRTEGHRAGIEALKRIAEESRRLGISVLTLYLFSTENWRRPASEVRFLMSLLRRHIRDNRDDLLKHNVRLLAIGDLSRLPAGLRREVARATELTRHCDGGTLVAALNYGSRAEITRAVQAIARKVQTGELAPGAVDEALIEAHLDTAGLPPPDLLIRTSGEKRLSNFLLWQASYAELYFTETLWPDFSPEEFTQALQEYARRKRRYGGLESVPRRPETERETEAQ
jgi:undecaprenyl diphosphate synthase